MRMAPEVEVEAAESLAAPAAALDAEGGEDEVDEANREEKHVGEDSISPSFVCTIIIYDSVQGSTNVIAVMVRRECSVALIDA